jgi:small subunit ribosomal protein S16
MAVKIRLQRKGRKKAPFYHIVVADARSPRDGRFIEKIGTYNPLTVPATISLQNDRAFHWIMVGAQPTDTVSAILRFKGVMYQKHLQVGVNKGAITQEQADAKLAAWVDQKDGKNEARRDANAKKKEEFRVKLDGVAKVKAKPVVVEEPAAEEAAPEATEETAPVVEAAAEETAAPAVEEAAAPATEEPTAE